MILQQLSEDAGDIVQRILGEDLPPPMYDRRPVRWFLELDAEGQALPRPFVDLQTDGKRGKKGVERLVPTLTRSGTRPPPVLLVDTAAYVLGLGDDSRAEEKHAAFKDLVAECAASTGEPSVQAVARFLETYTPGALDPPADLDPSHLIAFRVGQDVLPMDRPCVREFWAQKARPKVDGEAELQCLVCGNVRPIPEFLPLKIKGIPEGQSVGTALVSANANVFESYGLPRARNSPVCDTCGERSHKALNALLASEEHHLRVGRLVYVFWAPSGWSPVRWLAPKDPSIVKDLLRQPRSGRRQHLSQPERFAAMALSASGGRAVVRSWIQTTVPQAEENLYRWATWQRLVGRNGDEPRYHTAYHLAASLYRDFNAENQVQITQALIEAALNASPLPDSLLAVAVRRNCAAGLPDAGREALAAETRVALIKTVLASQRQLAEGDPWMSKTETFELSAAYHWGRLLAVLEIIQRKALEKPGRPLNSTIVDRCYGAASTAPGTVFGRLMAGAQDHLKKIRGPLANPGTAEALQKRIEEIVFQHLDSPASVRSTLTLREQALFALGYYHERAADRVARREAAEARRGSKDQTASTLTEAVENKDE